MKQNIPPPEPKIKIIKLSQKNSHINKQQNNQIKPSRKRNSLRSKPIRTSCQKKHDKRDKSVNPILIKNRNRKRNTKQNYNKPM